MDNIMDNIIISSIVHDGLIFFFTLKSITDKRKIIGFYFDRVGIPRSIHIDSIYGQHKDQ
jgi:hypothetical protein